MDLVSIGLCVGILSLTYGIYQQYKNKHLEEEIYVLKNQNIANISNLNIDKLNPNIKCVYLNQFLKDILKQKNNTLYKNLKDYIILTTSYDEYEIEKRIWDKLTLNLSLSPEELNSLLKNHVNDGNCIINSHNYQDFVLTERELKLKLDAFVQIISGLLTGFYLTTAIGLLNLIRDMDFTMIEIDKRYDSFQYGLVGEENEFYILHILCIVFEKKSNGYKFFIEIKKSKIKYQHLFSIFKVDKKIML